jgi:hypothetical protein
LKLVKKSILWCSLMGFLVIFSVAQVQAQSGGEQSGISGHEQLEKGKSVFQETWVHPDADFSQYTRIYIWDPVFEYRDVGPARRARSTMNSTHKREFGISDKDRQKIEEIVTAAFLKEMQKGKRFELVDTVGPDTLLLRAAVLDIISNVPPETAGRGDVYISSVGQGTFVMELIDSETGVVQALVAERRAMSRPGGGMSSSPASAPTIIADIRRWSSSAAQRLRKELDKAMAGR